MKQISWELPDGKIIVFDQATSEAIHMYAEVKKVTIEEAISEALKNLAKQKDENDSEKLGR